MDKQLRDTLRSEQEKQHEKEHAETMAHLKAKLQSAESALKVYAEEAGRKRALEKVIVEAITAADPYPHEPIILRGTESPFPMAAVADLSDLHIGEVVRPEETEGWGIYNWAIAESRLMKYAEKIVGWVNMHRHSFTIDDLYILGKGDYITGDIHEELMITNEFAPPEQSVKAGLGIGEFLMRLSPHFQKITFVGVGADNHSRLSKKPPAKLKAKRSYSFVVHEMAKAYCQRADNIDFIFAPGMKWVQEIANHRFLIEHGDTVKSVMGIPYYGMERSVARESRRRMLDIQKSFHYWSIAHYHMAGIISGNILMNGSLMGTTEYDHSAGRFAPPSQVSYLVHPKYGLFDFTPWKFPILNETGNVAADAAGKDDNNGGGTEAHLEESVRTTKRAKTASAREHHNS